MSTLTVTEKLKVCSFPDCGQKHSAKGWCVFHYRQHYLGDKMTLRRTTRVPGSPPRIVCDENANGCHVFRGCKINGYGNVKYKGKPIGVHRYIWLMENGPIPDGMVIDHICRNKACCNTEHLRLATQKQNTLENSNSIQAKNAIKTHCKRGHEFTPENTRLVPGGRACLKCDRSRYWRWKIANPGKKWWVPK